MFAAINAFAGTQPFNDWFTPDTVQRQVLGTDVTAVDPYWGQGEFMYLKSNDVILKGSLVYWDETFTAQLLAATANSGFPFAVAMAPAAAGTFFWAQIKGRAVYKTNATVAADTAVGVAAAGIVGASGAGIQLMAVRNRVSATGTVVLNANLTNNSAKIVTTKGFDGWFLGMALSGTGIPGSTIIAGLDPDGRSVYMGTAIGSFNSPATVSGLQSITGTYTGFGSGVILTPSVQGRIT